MDSGAYPYCVLAISQDPLILLVALALSAQPVLRGELALHRFRVAIVLTQARSACRPWWMPKRPMLDPADWAWRPQAEVRSTATTVEALPRIGQSKTARTLKSIDRAKS